MHSTNLQYPCWLEQNRLTNEMILAARNKIRTFRKKHQVSVIMPVYNTDPRWLRRAIDSVIDQVYPNWELCICDDGSSAEHVQRLLGQYAEQELLGRIKLTRNKKNCGIARASNSALQLAQGDFVALLDHDDELAPDAIFQVVRFLQEGDGDIVYTDEDKIDESGRRFMPYFKPDWSPDMFLSSMYTGHFTVYKRQLLKELGGFREGFEGSQDYDLMLRVSEKASRILHIPKVLYHWRVVPGSAAGSTNAKKYAYAAAKRAIAEALIRRGELASVADGHFTGVYRIRRKIVNRAKVKIIPIGEPDSKYIRNLLDALNKNPADLKYEVVLSKNASRGICSDSRHCVVVHEVDRIDVESYSAKANHLASQGTDCDHLLFLHEDVIPFGAEWLSAMVEHAQRSDVGVVGSKLLYPDQHIQHAGLVVSLRGLVGSPFKGLPCASDGYFGMPNMIRNCSAVSGACLMVKSSLFNELGGFDADHFRNSLFDVDMCLRAAERGHRTVYTPYSTAYHRETALVDRAQPTELEQKFFRKRWSRLLDSGDPYYNPNLSKTEPYTPEVHKASFWRTSDIREGANNTDWNAALKNVQ